MLNVLGWSLAVCGLVAVYFAATTIAKPGDRSLTAAYAAQCILAMIGIGSAIWVATAQFGAYGYLAVPLYATASALPFFLKRRQRSASEAHTGRRGAPGKQTAKQGTSRNRKFFWGIVVTLIGASVIAFIVYLLSLYWNAFWWEWWIWPDAQPDPRIEKSVGYPWSLAIVKVCVFVLTGFAIKNVLNALTKKPIPINKGGTNATT